MKLLLILFIGVLVFSTFASGATISVSPTELSGPGATGSVLISLDSANQGLSGYILSVYPEDSRIVTITGTSFPEWASLSEANPGEGAAFTIRALDLNDAIGSDARDVPLATLNLNGVMSGTTRIIVESRQIDDDLGEAIEMQFIPGSVTVSGSSVQTFDLNLQVGWNLIGIPMTLTSGSDTAIVFKDVPSAGHSIFTYNDVSGWKTIPKDEVLLGMNSYWIYSTEPVSIPLQVQGRPTMPKSLNAGWSIVSIPGTTPVSAAGALASLTDWTYVIGFDASLQQYQQPIIKGGSGQNSDQTLLNPGAGYWVFLSTPGQLIP
jgi:hypothetical protein